MLPTPAAALAQPPAQTLPEQRLRYARAILWIGVIAPYSYTTAKTLGDVQGGLSVLDAARGAGPAVCWLLARLVHPQPVRSLSRGVLTVGAAWFLTAAVASSLWSVDPRITALKCIPLVFTFVCLARLSRSYPSFTDGARAVFHIVNLILIAALAQLVVMPGIVYTGSVSDPVPRLNSMVPAVSANILGLVATVGLIGAALRVGPRWATKPAVAALLFAGYMLVLAATKSRTVLLVALLVAGWALLKAMHRSAAAAVAGWLGIAGAAVTVYALLGSAWAQEQIVAFFERGQNEQSLTTLTGRTELWDRALLVWQEHPLLGLGYYSGHRIGLATYFARFSSQSNIDHTWIESLVDVGVVGTAGLAVFALAALWGVLRAGADRHVRAAAGLAVTACLAVSFINPGIQDATPTLLIVGGLAFAARRPSSAGRVTRRTSLGG